MRNCPTCQRTYPDDMEFCPHDATHLIASVSGTEAQLASGLGKRFRIVRRLGAGGMGAVFLAEQIGVGNRPVALKVLNRKLLDAPEFLIRFQNEAGSTGRIRHPNVVTIYESAQGEDGTPYIAMEFLEGKSLRDALKERGALPVGECAEILQQTASGLNAAHKLGIIHRDLKPDNIFLTRGNEGELIIKVVDFGIAKLRESAIHTQTGMVLGTPAYMSFEQASGMRSDELDPRSDIYSLGVVVYEILAGRVPFQSDTPIGYLRKHMMEDPPPFRKIAASQCVSPKLEAVVMKALTKDREQRYSHVREFAEEFASAAQVVTSTAPKVPLPKARAVSAPQAGGLQTPTVRMAETPVELTGEAPGSTSSPRVESVTAHPKFMPQPPSPPAKRFTLVSSDPLARPDVAATKSKYMVAVVIVLGLIIGAGILYLSRYGTGRPNHEAGLPSSAYVNTPGTELGRMVAIPTGTFTMGTDNAENPVETPSHSASVNAFHIDKTPVTNAEYAEFVKAKGYPTPSNWSSGAVSGEQADWPVTEVSWTDAQAYCQWRGGRLPTEAEWEYAARGTDGRLYPWGNDFRAARVNSLEGGLSHPEAVGIRPEGASPFGLLDMSGNVWQWCADDYTPYPGSQAAIQIPADAKVIRGGSFKSDADHVRTTTRNLDHRTSRSSEIGFRCVSP